MKCSQTGKLHKVQIMDLSIEDGHPLTQNDLTKGSKMFMMYRGKEYPVEFVSSQGAYTNAYYRNIHVAYYRNIVYQRLLEI